MPKFKIQLAESLDVRYHTTSAERLNKYAKALRRIGLVEGARFTVKELRGGERGYLYITVEGVRKLAELSLHAEDESTRIEAARWVEHLLKRAGEETRRRVEELVEEGMARGGYVLTGLRREVVIDGERHVVEVREAKAWTDDVNRLRIWVKAVVDGIEVEREFNFGRYNNRVDCRIVPWTKAPGGREADRRRIETLSVVLFGDRSGTASGGTQLKYARRHLEYAMRFKEVKDAVEQWLNK